MNNLVKNKKIIFICSFLIILVFIIYLTSLKKDKLEIVNTEDYKYLKKYESNQYVPIYIEEEDIVKRYLNDFKNKMIFEVEEAYNSLNKTYREKKFVNLDGYKKYLEDIVSLSTYSMEVDKYSIYNMNGCKIINVIDKSGYSYYFKEISIMNYEVYLDDFTVVIE